MKFVVTGAAGHVSRPLAERLVGQGHDVTVIGRSPANLADLVRLGARAAIGDLRDVPFLVETFRGADGVYLMLPPMWDVDDQKAASVAYAEGYAAAIRATGVKHAVFLSSYGAHRLRDAGAISGMGLAEEVLNTLDGVNMLSLRAGYFYSNLLLSLDLVRSAGHLGNMFEVPDGDFTVVAPDDIARVAAEALEGRDFRGHDHVYVISDLTGTAEIAKLIGDAIGKPGLEWVRFPPDDFRRVLLGYGFAEGAADSYVEMFAALDRGVLFDHIKDTRPKVEGLTIEGFAQQFAAAYHQARATDRGPR